MSIYRAEHPYYGPEGGGYWAPGDRWDTYNPHHESWTEFLANGDLSGLPDDLNVLIRWDWRDGEWDDLGRDTLTLHYVLPRKGIFLTHTVVVTAEDEPTIREWLVPRWEYMQTLWAPFGGAR